MIDVIVTTVLIVLALISGLVGLGAVLWFLAGDLIIHALKVRANRKKWGIDEDDKK